MTFLTTERVMAKFHFHQNHNLVIHHLKVDIIDLRRKPILVNETTPMISFKSHSSLEINTHTHAFWNTKGNRPKYGIMSRFKIELRRFPPIRALVDGCCYIRPRLWNDRFWIYIPNYRCRYRNLHRQLLSSNVHHTVNNLWVLTATLCHSPLRCLVVTVSNRSGST
jgi:hypothetical protein